jgi:Tfp pilus assembly protein PilX
MSGMIKPEQGSIMLTTVVVFLVLTIVGMAIISITGTELNITANDVRAEQARQAADAGVQVGREVLLNYALSSRAAPESLSVELSHGVRVNLFLDVKRTGIGQLASITSQGICYDQSGYKTASKTVKAQIRIKLNDKLQSENVLPGASEVYEGTATIISYQYLN